MIELLFIKPVLVFIFNSPQEWILVIAVGFLLFGANRLPDLAKSLGKARNEFKKGMIEAEKEFHAGEAEEAAKKDVDPDIKPVITEIDDQALLEEIRRRQELANPPKQLNQVPG